MTPPRTLVVWCPDWSLTAAQVPSDAPAVVVRGNDIVACSAAARASGVHTGLRRREAQARCPEADILIHDPARDARQFEPVVAAVEKFTPAVEIVHPGQCAIATRGPSRYFGGDEALVRSVSSAVGEVIGDLGICQVGIADGLFAASLAARQSTIVPVGETPLFLAPLPARTLRDRELVDVLTRLGIRTLGEFAALPAQSVLARFGPVGSDAHCRAAGVDEHLPVTRLPAPEYAVTIKFDPPVERADSAAFAARQLAHEFHERLSSSGLACIRIAIEAETEHGEPLIRYWRHEGALPPFAVAERVRWQLDGWLTASGRDRPTAGLTLLRLIPDEVVPDNGRQLTFWGGEAEADDRAMRALVRVQGILGHDAVRVPVVQGGRSPADRIQWVTWGDSPSVLVDPDAPWPGKVPSPAPSVVYPAPRPARVVDTEGYRIGVSGRGVVSAAPRKLSVADGPWKSVVAWAGPWPCDERWWDRAAHRRRVRLQLLADGGEAFLTLLEKGQWWVEGVYA